MRRTIHALLLTIVATAAVSVTAAGPARIKLATLAPANSPWTDALRLMGEDWTTSTAGRLKLAISAGEMPSESEIIVKIDLDNFQAATLMIAGLGEVDEAFNVFGIPFFFESDEEMAHAQQKLTPLIQTRLLARRPTKLRLINWGHGGWVRLFSKMPIRTVQELKRAKLCTTVGDDRVVRWYASNGFTAVPLPAGRFPSSSSCPPAPSTPPRARPCSRSLRGCSATRRTCSTCPWRRSLARRS